MTMPLYSLCAPAPKTSPIHKPNLLSRIMDDIRNDPGKRLTYTKNLRKKCREDVSTREWKCTAKQLHSRETKLAIRYLLLYTILDDLSSGLLVEHHRAVKILAALLSRHDHDHTENIESIVLMASASNQLLSGCLSDRKDRGRLGSGEIRALQRMHKFHFLVARIFTPDLFSQLARRCKPHLQDLPNLKEAARIPVDSKRPLECLLSVLRTTPQQKEICCLSVEDKSSNNLK